MTRCLACIAFTVASALSLTAEQTASKPAETTRVVQLTLRPAPVPQPALKYHLLPDLLDQTPGNAAVLHLTAGSMLAGDFKDKWDEHVSTWQSVPLKDLPRQDVRRLLDDCASALRQLELGAFRESCQWDLPIRSEGFNLMLPSLSTLRSIAKVLSVRIRLNLIEGKADDVFHDLQTGFALARQVSEGPTLVHALVGVAIAGIMMDRVEELVLTPDCPNLYWALTDVPRPLVDLRPALRYERSSLFFTFPQLRDPRTASLSAKGWQGSTNDLLRLFGRPHDYRERLGISFVAAKTYPQAKRYLISSGYTSEQVEAMPVLQVVAIHATERFNYWKDEVFKWFDLPYCQAWKGMRDTGVALSRASAQGDGQPFVNLLPNLSKVYTSTTSFDRRIAALQCVEAVRLYAASHDGKFPASLSQISEVPIPIDPITGQAFRYEAVGKEAVLEWAPPPGLSPKHGTRYELTLVR